MRTNLNLTQSVAALDDEMVEEVGAEAGTEVGGAVGDGLAEALGAASAVSTAGAGSLVLVLPLSAPPFGRKSVTYQPEPLS